MNEGVLMSLAGGGIIGIATALFLAFNGRVTGISGIVNGLLTRTHADYRWRLFFVIGMVLGGVFLATRHPELFHSDLKRNSAVIMIAGLLVGFGTVMGSGCTSGHGICGIARMSPRSIVATISFMLAGILMANFVRWVVGI
ncbi:YeeE/YedE family protein [Bdellovibrio sp. HCB209]|uniref:YeeE/YedE family protein n=1 Tax=Bdellovibrio sp. HCB209 TaxID=3394354 RepID=UPI0039B543BD